MAYVWDRTCLGYRGRESFGVAKGWVVKVRVSPKALRVSKERVQQITSRSGGQSLEQVTGKLRSYLRGWKQYFGLADTPGVFRGIDQWSSHRLRKIELKQWKRGRTAYRDLQRRSVGGPTVGIGARFAQSCWRVVGRRALNIALPGKHFEQLGVLRLPSCEKLNSPKCPMRTHLSGGVRGECWDPWLPPIPIGDR